MISELRALLLLVAIGTCVGDSGPHGGLDSIDGLLKVVLNSPKLTPDERKLAQHVADDVHKDIVAFESDKTLTDEAKKALTQDAAKELRGLQGTMKEALIRAAREKVAQDEAMIKEKKLVVMKKELEVKQAELEEQEAEAKLLKLNGGLAATKAEMAKLADIKARSQKSRADQAKEAEEQGAMISKLLALAKSLAEAKRPAHDGVKPAQSPQMAALVSEVRQREEHVKSSIAQMDAVDKKDQAQLDGMAKANPSLGKSHGESVLRSLKRQYHRQYHKARAVRTAELANLKAVTVTLEKGDLDALQRALVRMQKDTNLHPGSFLH